MKKIKKMKWTFLGISILTLLIGICLVVWPYMSATILCYLLGMTLLIVGIIRINCYFQGGLRTFLFSYYELPVGILNIFTATIFLLHPHNMVVILPIFIGSMIFFDSIFKLQLAIDFKRQGIAKWWYMLLSFIVCTVFAVLLILNPFEGSIVLMIFIGISLILDSIQNILTILYIVKHIKNIMPIDADYREMK